LQHKPKVITPQSQNFHHQNAHEAATSAIAVAKMRNTVLISLTYTKLTSPNNTKTNQTKSNLTLPKTNTVRSETISKCDMVRESHSILQPFHSVGGNEHIYLFLTYALFTIQENFNIREDNSSLRIRKSDQRNSNKIILPFT
jgi:xanthine dehydrogenase molybdopterin-binding subunit B